MYRYCTQSLWLDSSTAGRPEDIYLSNKILVTVDCSKSYPCVPPFSPSVESFLKQHGMRANTCRLESGRQDPHS